MQTIVEPTGVDTRIDTMMPIAAQNTDMIAEHTITDRKFLNTRIDDSAGKITSAEMSSEPTRFIANTIIDAVMIAMTRLYRFVFKPVALENISSKVIANIL